MSGARAGSIVALASALLLGGCGSDDVEETRVPARSYVTDICDATTTWLDDVQALNEELQAQMEPTSLDVVKDTMLTFFDDAISATDRLLSDVEAAGVPDVPDGEQTARRVSTALGDIRDALTDARGRVEAQPIDPPEEFAAELQATAEQLQVSIEDAAGTLESCEVPELEEAADDVAACDELAA